MSVTREQWVAALRSGDYEQGHGVLRSTDDTYCCLGVFCDLVDPNGWHTIEIEDAYGWRDQHTTAYPPDDVLHEAGLTMTQGIDLACANDQGDSFAEIADKIERL